MTVINVGYDASGNGNNWTTNNIDQNTSGTGADVLVDVPTLWGTDTGTGGEVRGNYCTINRLDLGAGASATLLNNGNLQFGTTADGNAGDGNNVGFRSTIGVTSGKWYIEGTKINSTNDHQGFGFGTPTIALGTWNGGSTNSLGANDQFIGISGEPKAFIKSGGTLNSTIASGFSYVQGDVFGIAFDLDNFQVSIYLNGSQLGSTTGFTPPTGVNTYFVTHSQATTWHYPGWALNFGQRPFAYSAPSGFAALCTQNLPEPTIADGSAYMNAVLYTGNNQTLQSITTVGFQPDLIWIKNRNASNHVLVDSVRGRGYHLASNLPNAEATDSSTQGVTAFLSNGFSVEADPASYGSVNDGTNPYVAWNWKANGAGVSNTDGSITSTVSANTTSGFSIVTFTMGSSGTNFSMGHGLGVKPAMIIYKNRGGNNWQVAQKSLGAMKDTYITLNGTGGSSSSTDIWYIEPTSTLFGISTNVYANSSNVVAYCFAPVAGFSAFGSYTGNGSTDGPFVFTGFRPRWIMTKSTSNLREWYIYDSARDTYNVCKTYLRANTSAAEGSFDSYDMLSNGFKLRSSDTAFNGSGETYIYAAFASNPFKFSLGA